MWKNTPGTVSSVKNLGPGFANDVSLQIKDLIAIKRYTFWQDGDKVYRLSAKAKSPATITGRDRPVMMKNRR